MAIKDEIIRIYERPVIAHPGGAVVHMGDCHIYDSWLGICTCGLHHLLQQAGSEVAQEVYPRFQEEKTNESFVVYLLQEFRDGNLYVKNKGKFVQVETKEVY
jgi:hypothetical protein